VPFVRFSRDRRGYEHTYLIHAAPRRGAPTRILYWYRTPPGIKVGREALDAEARRMLEAQYPSVPFDWPKLLETPMPPPEAENWRERRRVERSARQARQTGEPEDLAVEPIETPGPAPAPVQEPAVEHAPLTADSANTDSAGSENAVKKRRRRGGRRRRRPGSPTESGSLADHASDPDADTLLVQSGPNAESGSPAQSSPPDSESTGTLDTKAPD
jgi:ribonuclease E